MVNSKELSALDKMNGLDYAAMIYAHLIDKADTVNARFVWKRASEKI